jgi:hypothetical protein
VTGADAFCQSFVPGGTNATGSQVPSGTSYKAYLLPANGTAAARFTGTGGTLPRGWVRVDGRPFMDQLADADGKVRYPLRVGANGADIGAVGPLAATNSDYYGNGGTSDCTGYTSLTGSVGTGLPSGGGGVWLLDGGISCGSAARYYCLGIDYVTPLSYAAAAGRIAFVSGSTWKPGMTINGSTGIASADALCQMEATNASLPSPTTFLAAMSTTTAAAASRFDTTGAPWVRVDGVQLAATAAAFFDLSMLALAPLDISATASVYETYWIWTGSTTPQTIGTTLTTCSDWISTSAAVGPTNGVSGYTDANRWYESPTPYSNPYCTFPAGHVYCLQK